MKSVLGLSVILFIALISTLQVGLTSCTKETIVNNHDTVIIHVKDTIPVVNAGRDTAITLNTINDSLRLNGSATDANGTVVAYLWSQVSGPNTAHIRNPGSASTYVGNLVGGVYTFQLMATDNDGETGVRSVRVSVTENLSTEVVMQPENNPNEVMVIYTQARGEETNPATPELDAVAWTVNGGDAYLRSYFKFDLSSIPANARIVSAKLSLYSNLTPLNGNLVDANYGSNNAMLIQRVSSNWSTSTIRWSNQPSLDAASQVVIPHTNQSFLDLTDVDVTSMVQTMVTSGNYGWVIKLQNESIYNSRHFYSSRASNAAKRPKLVVKYAR